MAVKMSPKERMALALKKRMEAVDNGVRASQKEPAVEENPMPAKQETEPVVEAPAVAPAVRRKKRRGIGAAATALPKTPERKEEQAEEKPAEELRKEKKPEEKPKEEPKKEEKIEEEKDEGELPSAEELLGAIDELAEGEARPLDELIEEGRIDEAYNKVNQELAGNPGERAECLLKIGLKCKDAGKGNEAVKYCNEALTAAKNVSDENERGELSIKIRNEMKSNGIKILLSMGRSKIIPPPPKELKPPEAGKPAKKPKPLRALHVFGPSAEEDDKTRVEAGEDSQTEIYEDFGVRDADDDSVTEEVDEILEEESKEESTHEETTLLFEALEDDEKTVVNETSRKLKKDIDKSGEDPILVILKELEAIKGTVGMVIDTKIKAAKTDLEARMSHRLSKDGDIGKRINEKIETEVEDEGRLGTLLINILRENPDVLAELKETLALEEVGRAEAQEKAVEAREELDVMELKREMLNALGERDGEKAAQKWGEIDSKYSKMLDEETGNKTTAELLYEVLRLGEEHLKENYGLSDEEADYIVGSMAFEKVAGALVEDDFQGRLEIHEEEYGTESLARGLKAVQELGVKGMLEKGVPQENAEKAVERANQIMNFNQEGDG